MSTDALFAALDACAERDRLLTRLAAATTDEARAAQRAERARSQVSTETTELRALEDFSPTQLWAKLRGTHSSDLEREQAELAAAVYQSRVADGALSEASSVVRQLRTELAALGDVDQRRRRAMDDTEAELRRDGGPAAAELVEIAAELAASQPTLARSARPSVPPTRRPPAFSARSVSLPTPRISPTSTCSSAAACWSTPPSTAGSTGRSPSFGQQLRR